MEREHGKRKKCAIVIAVGIAVLMVWTAATTVWAESATGAKVSYKGPVSSMGTTCGKFKIKGRDAFCAEHPKATPPTGTKITSTKLVTNNKMRKALYYGYGGPEAKVKKNNAGWVSTSVALSRANGKGGGTASARKFYNSLGKYPVPPDNFKVYLCNTAGGKQDLCYWIYTPEGKLRVEKVSSVPAIIHDGAYSLEGAVYGIYTEKECDDSSMAMKITTGDSGVSDEVTLQTGEYYIKELMPPKGFLLSDVVYPVSITDKCNVEVTVENIPEEEPAWIMIQKVDAESGDPVPIENGELKNAEFTVKYYEGTEWDDDPSKVGVEEQRSWIYKTKENGSICFSDEECFVSGDERYYNDAGKLTLPIGTITIQETKAPKGYVVNNEIFTVKILEDDNVPGVSLSQIPTVEVEQKPIRGDVEIIKTDSKTGEPLSGVAFDVIDARKSTVVATLITNENGYATTATEGENKGSLLYGEYILSETETPAGYVPAEDIRINVDEYNEMITLEIENTPAEIGTRAYFKANHSKEILPIEGVTLVDEVRYKNLIPGTEYRMEGILMDTKTGEALLINEEKVWSEMTFTANSSDGTINMEFILDATDLAGKAVTVFEYLYMDEVLVASHADITDSEQTVSFSTVEYYGDSADTGDAADRFIPMTLALLIISCMGAIVTVRKRE